jgi:hypothetical protein
MELEELKRKLISSENITFSAHYYEPKVQIRGISEEEIIDNLKNPDKLLSFVNQGEEPQGHRYALLFSKSGKYDIRIVVSIKDKSIKVITSHIQNIKRRKVFEQWLKKRR